MSSSAARLYEQDFVRWTEQQAAALRAAADAATNLPLDWENLAEEIDSLGRSTRRELRSRIAVIIEHLLKLESSPATDPRPGWLDTVGRERADIEDLLADSPSLRGEVAEMVARATPRTSRFVARSLFQRGEISPSERAVIEAAAYTAEQVLGDWFPGEAPPPANGEGVPPASAP